jgi:hypothetical protein
MSIYQEVANYAELASTIDGTTRKGPSAGIYFGSGGTAVVQMAGRPGTDVTFANVPAGSYLPLSICKWVSGPADAVAIMVI